jgi:DNA ligase-1
MFNKLYAKSSTGKIKEWSVDVVNENDKVYLIVTSGYIDGKKVTSKKQIFSKNKGRSNETSPYEQACFDAQSKINKKKDEGYVFNIKDLENQVLLLPMLAHSYQVRKNDITWPAYIQPKLNGVRCIATMDKNSPLYLSRKGKSYTTLKHLNDDVEKLICKLETSVDGEVFHPEFLFQEIIKAVKKDRKEQTDKLQYWVYDVVDPNTTFEDRYKNLKKAFESEKITGNLVLVETILVNSEKEMIKQHKEWTKQGFEGTIIRNKNGKYILRHRSADIQKYKDFIDDEYEIIGAHEATGNDKGTAVFELKTKEGLKFSARPKGSREIRRKYLEKIDSLKGLYATVKYQELSKAPEGYKEGVPIFPVVLSIRNYE